MTSEFPTRSPLIATWLVYSRRIPYLRYDAETRQYIFHDPDGIHREVIAEFETEDPIASVKRFHRLYMKMVGEKVQLDRRLKEVKKSSGIMGGFDGR